MHICTYSVYIHTYVRTYIWCVRMHICTYSVYIHTYVHTVCTYAHTYVHMVCTYAHTGTKLHHVESPTALLYSRVNCCVSVGLVQAHGGVTQCEHLKTHTCLQGGDLRQSGQVVPVQVQHHQVGEPTPEAATWYVAQLPPQEEDQRRIGVAVGKGQMLHTYNLHTQTHTYVCTYL